ncbi:MAG: YbjN domain-containing protein, partial [Cyanobacteria bacterium P01_H01_bin.121]
QQLIHFSFKGDNGAWNCYAQALEDDQQFAFYSVLTVQAPVEKRPLMAEFITRANYSLIIGNFEMDYDDGEIRYKTSIVVQDSRLDSALIRQIVYSNLFRVDQYLPGISGVLESGLTPEQAIDRVE